MTRALLVDVLARGRGGRYASLDVVGVGPRLVAGIMEQHGVRVDLRVYEDVVAEPRVMERYDALLVSGMSVDKPGMRRLAALWRRFGEGLAIAGGPASLEHEELLSYGYDAVVIGEGERQLDALARLLRRARRSPRLSGLKGLCGLALSVPRGRVARCPPTPREILNRYRASGRHLEGYGEPWALRFYVEVVRGCSNFYRTLLRLPDGRKCVLCDLCRSGPLGARVSCPIGIPAGCGYCGVPEIYGPPRSRDPRVVASEIRELVDHGATRIVLSAPDILDYGRDLLVDPLPLTDPRSPPPNLEALEELFETILAVVPEARDGDVVVFIENIKPNLVDERVAELLGRYFKGTPVHIGVETGDPEHARALGRPASPEEALRAARLLRRHGMRPYVYFIHGLPGQTLITARRTVSLMKKLGRAGVEKVTVYRFTPLPGTAFQDMPPAPPAYRDKASLMIVREASRINIEAKRRMLGRDIPVVIAGAYKGRALAYPLRHGPVILIEDRRALRLIGRRAVVRVTGVAERMVLGRLVAVLGEAIKHGRE